MRSNKRLNLSVYSAWRVMRPQLRVMSRARRTALILTAPYLLLAGLALSPASFGGFLEAVIHLDSLYLAVWILFGAAASSIVLVELLRVVFRQPRLGRTDNTSRSWPRAGFSWPSFSPISSGWCDRCCR